MRESPEKRESQRVLAAECTAIVHGKAVVESVEAASRILFGQWAGWPSPEVVETLAREVPVTAIPAAGISLVDLLVKTGIAESKGAARKLIEGGGIYLNNVRQTAPQEIISSAMLLRSGKKNYHLVRIIE